MEKEIADIEKQLAQKKAALEAQGKQTAGQEKEILHEVVGSRIKEMAPPGLPSVSPTPVIQPPPAAALPPPATEPPSYLSPELKNKVQELVNTAFTKNLSTATKEAYMINNPALLDAFHDVLVDQLYDTLVERGKLEKV